MASTVTNTGIAHFVTVAVTDDTLKYIDWGTGSGQGAGDNALAAAAGESRTSGTASAQTTNTTGDTYQVAGSITATATRAITEVGVFDASTSGNMGIYGDFSVINLNTDDSITFTIQAVGDQA